MKKFKITGLFLLAFLLVIILYSTIRANYLKYQFVNLYSNPTINLGKYPDSITIANGDSNNFSFARNHILPDFLYIDALSISLIERIFHVKSEYSLCFENVSFPFKLTEGRSCNWFNCGGYTVGTYGINYWPDQPRDDQNLTAAFNSFSKNMKVTEAKVTKDKSCENYNKINGLHEYEVEFFESEVKLHSGQ